MANEGINWQRATFLLQLVTLVLASIAGFVAYHQLKQGTDVLASNAVGGLNEHLVTVSQLFIEKPERRPYFYEGAEVPPDKRQEMLAVAEALADLFDNAFYQNYFYDADRDAWLAYFSDIRANSPIFRDFLSEHCHWYGQSLIEAVQLSCPARSRN
jgi:hypothetical protein